MRDIRRLVGLARGATAARLSGLVSAEEAFMGSVRHTAAASIIPQARLHGGSLINKKRIEDNDVSLMAMRGSHGRKSNQQKVFSSSIAEKFDLLPPDVGLVQVEGCFETGFIVADVQVEGSILCVGDLWMKWKPSSLKEVTEDSLALVDVVLPVPELLVLGCGSRIQQVPENLMKYLNERYMSVEALDTRNAVSTFNILNQEGRKVVGAFLPSLAD